VPFLKVEISQWVDDHQPGFVECVLTDADGQQHRFVEKVPIVTVAELDPASSYPQQGEIDCTVVRPHHWSDGKQVVEVDTGLPWGVESTEGQTRFIVLSEHLGERN
jgi:hypothetical protein